MNAMKQLIKEASSEQKCFAIENALELRAKRKYYITAWKWRHVIGLKCNVATPAVCVILRNRESNTIM